MAGEGRSDSSLDARRHGSPGAVMWSYVNAEVPSGHGMAATAHPWRPRSSEGEEAWARSLTGVSSTSGVSGSARCECRGTRARARARTAAWCSARSQFGWLGYGHGAWERRGDAWEQQPRSSVGSAWTPARLSGWKPERGKRTEEMKTR